MYIFVDVKRSGSRLGYFALERDLLLARARARDIKTARRESALEKCGREFTRSSCTRESATMKPPLTYPLTDSRGGARGEGGGGGKRGEKRVVLLAC